MGWLELYPFLVPFLFEGHERLRKYFPNEPMALQVSYDPEDARLTHLTALVLIGEHMNGADVSERMDRFCQDWWFDVMNEVDLKLQFYEDFGAAEDYDSAEEGNSVSAVSHPASIHQSDFDQLTGLYTVQQPEEVWEFLHYNSFLIPHLYELSNQIRRYFPDAPLSLSVGRDPEEPALDHLMLEIAANLPVKVGLDRLEQFEDEWLPNTRPSVRMKLLVNVEPT